MEVVERLAQSEEAACRWVGSDARRELASPKVRSALARRATRAAAAPPKKSGRAKR
jgi:hypothetical protein